MKRIIVMIVLGGAACWLLLMVWLQFNAPYGMTPVNVARTLAKNVSGAPTSEGCDVAVAAFDTRLRGEEAGRLGMQAHALSQISDVSELRPPPTAAALVLIGTSGVKVGDARLELADVNGITAAAQRERNYRDRAEDPMRDLYIQMSATAKLSDVAPVLQALLQTGEIGLAVREANVQALPTLANAPDWYAPLAKKLESAELSEQAGLISAELARLTEDSSTAKLAFLAMPQSDERANGSSRAMP